ncbi:DUF6722 family protein [Capnocytophaga canimorsus]|uniref:DUF6722 family protein n=1 Tax=Capnocytophaga canimorsus TaxID=28188 RepID=UPI0037CFF67D
MRKEFGKLLLDVVKYLITAILISNLFTEVEGKDLYLTAIPTITVLTICGLLLVRERKEPSKNKKVRNNKK